MNKHLVLKFNISYQISFILYRLAVAVALFAWYYYGVLMSAVKGHAELKIARNRQLSQYNLTHSGKTSGKRTNRQIPYVKIRKLREDF